LSDARGRDQPAGEVIGVATDIVGVAGPVADGAVLQSADEFVDQIGPFVSSLEEVDSILIDAIPTRVFDVVGDITTQPTLQRSPDDQHGWFAPPVGRIWLIDHPERGLLMATVESGRSGTAFDASLARAERIVTSIEFVESN